MSSRSKVIVYDEFDPEIQIVSGPDSSLRVFGEETIVRIYEPGPPGPRGIQGEKGFSGAGEPFFVIQSGSIYGTTGSLALFSSFSSSLLPFTSSNYTTTFDLGSLRQSWNNVYISQSIFIVKNGTPIVTIQGSENTVTIGQSQITTSSFGFDGNRNLNRITNNQHTFLVASESVSASFNLDGVFIVSEFNRLPTSFSGGIVKSGSEFFVGI